MTPVIMKVGAQSSYTYFIRGNYKIADLFVGQRIKFRPQKIAGARWVNGVIDGFAIDMPLVSLI